MYWHAWKGLKGAAVIPKPALFSALHHTCGYKVPHALRSREQVPSSGHAGLASKAVSSRAVKGAVPRVVCRCVFSLFYAMNSVRDVRIGFAFRTHPQHAGAVAM